MPKTKTTDLSDGTSSVVEYDLSALDTKRMISDAVQEAVPELDTNATVTVYGKTYPIPRDFPAILPRRNLRVHLF